MLLQCLRYVKKIEIMIMIMIIFNVLLKRLISQKYKKCFPGKYALLLYVAVSIRWISITFDFYIDYFNSVKNTGFISTIVHISCIYLCVHVNFTLLKEKNFLTFKKLILNKIMIFKLFIPPAPLRALYLIWHIVQVRYCFKKLILSLSLC